MNKELNINKIQCDFMINDLVDQILMNNERFTHVIGIANGGLNISIPVSKKLKLPHKSVTIRFYGNDKKPHDQLPKETDFVSLNGLGQNCNVLFCDDLIDRSDIL
jgi:hypoxanthine phosphoribosyltransferase